MKCEASLPLCGIIVWNIEEIAEVLVDLFIDSAIVMHRNFLAKLLAALQQSFCFSALADLTSLFCIKPKFRMTNEII